jgi:hypothetical protein
MAQSMPRNASRAQPPRGATWRFRPLVLSLLVLALLGADEPLPVRPVGMSALESVEMALELALLAEHGWEPTEGGMDQARGLLRAPELRTEQLRGASLEAAGRWSGRSEPARRLYAAWARMEQAEERSSLAALDGSVGQLARIDLVSEFCAALRGGTHLPPSQAAGLLARSAAVDEPIHALERVGVALERLEPTTLFGAHQISAWRELLAEARLPATVAGLWLPHAQGLPLDRPMAPLIVLEAEHLTLSSRGLVSWREGSLSVDQGPAAERVEGWSSAAWQRWQAIGRRRSELSLAGITVLVPIERNEPELLVPHIAAHPDLPVGRLVELMVSLEREGVQEACLLVQPGEQAALRRVCAPFRARAPAEAELWRLGPGGLFRDSLPGAAGEAWVLVEPGALVADWVLALEEARHSGRRLGLASEASR